MSVYLDTSVLVSLFVADRNSSRARAFAARLTDAPRVSTWGILEFASAISAKHRARDVTAAEAAQAFARFDQWVDRAGAAIALEDRDVRACALIVRRPEAPLKAPDALHIAICQRIGLGLATTDDQMARAARVLGLSLAAI